MNSILQLSLCPSRHFDLEKPGGVAAKDRAALGLNAPPQGLYFAGATYP